MNDSAKQDNLELEVTDFGPIIKAKVDLRPLTVFIGPSNTGKSYLAILIYALHRYFSSGVFSAARRVSRMPLRFRSARAEKLPKETMDDLIRLAKQTATGEGMSPLDEGIVLPTSVADLVRSIFEEQSSSPDDEIERCFGVYEPGSLIRKNAKGVAGVVLRRHDASESAPVDHRLTISSRGSEFKTVVPEGTRLRIGVGDDNDALKILRHLAAEMTWQGHGQRERSRIRPWSLLETLSECVRPQFFGPLDFPAFYLPASRTGVMHTRNAVTRALIGGAARGELRPIGRAPMLSGVLADFLEQLVEPDANQGKRDKSGDEHATRVEDAILGGSVRIERTDGIGSPQFTFRPRGWKNSMLLLNASSMVSELAPVVLYLRHMVEPGNVLIVEEPESHLHPAMQVEFTRQLAALVKSGIRVIVTTHSEWVLEELGNIVRRSELSKTGQQGSIDDKVALRPDEVGAWLFKQRKRPKGSVVEEVKLDDETGLYPTDFDVVSEELYNENVSIFNRIQRAKASDELA